MKEHLPQELLAQELLVQELLMQELLIQELLMHELAGILPRQTAKVEFNQALLEQILTKAS